MVDRADVGDLGIGGASTSTTISTPSRSPRVRSVEQHDPTTSAGSPVAISRATMDDVGAVEDFVALLDSQGFGGIVETDAATRVVYGTDNSIYQLRPVGVAIPRSIEDLAAIASANSRLEQPFELVARGGGTGTNGQSLTAGLVVDTRRAMNEIISIDAAARRAVVQPGVVLGRLNAALRPHGLFFAPHVSTASRATIGGMVSTDAAGKGSLVHGRTNDHVVSIDVVLDDGTPWTFRALDPAELADICARGDRVGEIHRAVRDAVEDLDPAVFPDIPRGFSGYDLAGAAAMRQASTSPRSSPGRRARWP